MEEKPVAVVAEMAALLWSHLRASIASERAVQPCLELLNRLPGTLFL